MKTGRTLVELATEIQRRSEAKKDYIAPVEKLEAKAVEMETVTAKADGQSIIQHPGVELAVANGSAGTSYPLTALAHSQLAEYVGIPLPYYKRMLSEAPGLLRDNINRWFLDTGKDRRMVRTLDGAVRAFLSDRYRPLENEDLMEAVLPILAAKELLLVSMQVTDTRLYIKAVDKNVVRDIPTGAKLGEGHTRFDTVSPAIVISNSEVGMGSVLIQGGVWTGGCTNLAIYETSMRKYHTGARAELSDEVYALLTDNTKKLTDAAVWAQVRDLVTAVFDQARFDAQVMKLGKAAEQKLPAEDVVQVVERVGRRFLLTGDEQKGILTRLIEGGDLTKYGLHAAVTRHAADVESYDRATELERVGGQVIELSPDDFKVDVAA
jgi:hypothetical protein